MTLRPSAFLLVLVALASLAGCSRYHAQPPEEYRTGNNLEKTRYQAELTAPDGTKVRFTVWQPELRKGETAPLILHAHGFSLTRMDSKVDLYSLLLAGEAVQQAWDRGYWVISYDQRGHGGTGGKVSLLDRDKEVADVSRLVDWAVQNLALSAVDGDPLVGMVGESYGGAIQVLASVDDPRIDALVPITTWFNLEQALVPDGVPKSEWMLFLGVAGYGANPFHMDWGVTTGAFKEIIMNTPQPALRQQLRRNSPSTRCDGGEYPHADALLIQGMRDVLFPLNQAIDARNCFLKAGRDARLIAVEHGHLAPTAQLSPRIPIWHVNPSVFCDGRSYSLKTMIGAWFDLKLRGSAVPDTAIPTWCLTGDRAVDAAGQPPPSMAVPVPEVHVGSGAAGLVEWAARPLETAKNWFVPNGFREGWDQPKNGWLRPARVPLLRIDGPTWVAGPARAQLQVSDADRAFPILFLRLAAWKPGSGNYRVLSQQVTPVRGEGMHEIELGAVRAKLQKGEVLGLLVNGYSNQFRLAGSGWGTDATLSGTLEVPLAGASGPARTAGR